MDKKDLAKASDERKWALEAVNERFAIGESVRHLQRMMTAVTQKDVTADTVNAACNCVANINATIKTTIAAARFLADKD